MTGPAETNEEANGQPSPYAPPPVVDERIDLGLTVLPAGLPIGISLAYAVGATMASGVLMLSMSSGFRDFVGYALFASPVVLMAGFVLLCFAYFEHGGGAIRSVAWKATVAILVPISSMILFVPTCIGSGIFVFSTIGNALGEMTVAIPFFIGYWVTCLVIAMRIRSRMARPPGEDSPGPYVNIETESELRSPLK